MRLLHTASNGKGDKDNEIHAALLFQKTRVEYEGVKGQVENLFRNTVYRMPLSRVRYLWLCHFVNKGRV